MSKVEDQGAEEALWVYAKREFVTYVWEAVSRAIGSPFSYSRPQTWSERERERPTSRVAVVT